MFELNRNHGYSIDSLCVALEVSRSGYYKWLKKVPSRLEIENQELTEVIKKIFDESDQTFGVVRVQTALKRQGKAINIKRVRRLMRLLGLKSVIRRPRQNYVKTVAEYTAENIIARDFEAEKPNQKWFTDVSYLKYGNGEKAYISAIIDRYDMSIVSWKVSKRNDNELVMETIKEAFELNPGATPIIHSDRGYPYTSKEYKILEKEYDFTISMSRVSKCLDNQPIESFWGVMKSEYYYRYKYISYNALVDGIKKYIDFYMNKRFVPKFEGLTPFEFRQLAA